MSYSIKSVTQNRLGLLFYMILYGLLNYIFVQNFCFELLMCFKLRLSFFLLLGVHQDL